MDRTAQLCRGILEQPRITQRELARIMDVSLGTVNSIIKECSEQDLIAADNGQYRLTDRGTAYLERFRVDGALILAAGFGSRFVPLTFETPKGLLEVFGERMIERQIRQLHEAGIRKITIAVGYLKEKFEYLIDKYGVELLYNPEYASKNNLSTIYHARKVLEGNNMYILSSDNWMRDNMFHSYECGSWYSAVYKEGETSEWCFSYNKKGRVLGVREGGRDSWVMFGPVYLSADFLADFLPVVERYYHSPGTEQFYWEHVYKEMLDGSAWARLGEEASRNDKAGPDEKASRNDKAYQDEKARRSDKTRRVPELYVNFQPDDMVYEFENLEELRRFDTKYQDRSDNEALELIARVFRVKESEIHNIRCVKAGMTNQSFLFQVRDRSYICRIPGPGTGLLIDRKQEAASFRAVEPLGISEKILYFDQDTGYKISEYYEGARNSDPHNPEDVGRCMELLRKLHESGIQVSHSFDIRERISFYENLCKSHGEIPFEDYSMVKSQMVQLMDNLDRLNRPRRFSHVDSVADNFLFLPDGSVRLIDLEYAGMCDQLIDVSMCAIYSYYTDEQIDWLIRLYLQREPTEEETTVVYSYVALGGFLWSLWAVYKSFIGQEFGEYTIIMYRYAKRFYRKLFPPPREQRER